MALQHLRSSTANKRPLPANMADGQVAVNTNTSSPGLFVKDSAAGLLKIGPTHIGTTAPNLSPAAGGATGNTVGEQWLDTTGANPLLKVWDGSAWRTVQPVTTGTVVSTTDVGTITSTMILDETIANVDISTTASIAHSKLASITAGNILLGNASNVPTATTVSGDITITSAGVTTVSNGAITNAKVSASAGIVDTKLATISTAGKVSNSATTATNGNTANAIVARDANGNFSAGTISAALNGNASTVTTNANLTGDVTSVGNATSIATGVIVDADVNASAAIAYSKLAALNSANIIVGSSTNVPTARAVTGDVTISNTGVTAIAAGVIVNADVNASAAIAGTKISPNFGSQTITTTGIISPAIGTAAAPSIAFTGDTNTGIYSPGADQVAVATDGTGRLFVNSTGLAGIGTSSPQARLEIARLGSNFPVTGIDGNVGILVTPGGGISTSGALINCVGGDTGIAGLHFGTASSPNTGRIFQDNSSLDLRFSTNSTERLRITSAGLVGIGTSAPESTLQVNGTVSFGEGSILSSSILPHMYRSGGNLFIQGRTDGGAGGAINLATAGTSRISVLSGGNVGIGTTSPASTLTVVTGAVSDVFGGGNGHITLGGSSSSLVVPSIRGRSNESTGLRLLGATLDGNTDGDLVLDARSTAGGNFTTLTNNLLRVTRFGANILTIARNGSTTINASAATAPFIANIGASEVTRIDSSGRLLVGTSTARTNYAGSGSPIIQAEATTASGSQIGIVRNENNANGSALILGKTRATSIGGTTSVNDSDTLGFLIFEGADGTNLVRAAQITANVDGTPGANDMPGRLVFSTTADGASSPTERMRIASNGRVDTFSSIAGIVSYTSAAAGTTVSTFVGAHSSTGVRTGTNSFVVFSNGNVQNTNNSYGSLSDIKLKENIIDAKSQWDDLKALQVRNYNLKEGQTHRQIGLIAQEAELVSPGLVFESPDRDPEGNDLGTVTKSVNYSVLYMKAVKALQEAMERIEQLEQRLADAGIA
jgi:hypothetical protein